MPACLQCAAYGDPATLANGGQPSGRGLHLQDAGPYDRSFLTLGAVGHAAVDSLRWSARVDFGLAHHVRCRIGGWMGIADE
eukprot:10609060-Prorocentrum_lima.AAC.1